MKKSSLKTTSFYWATLSFMEWKFALLLIDLPTLQAVYDLFEPTCCFLNRNCLFRLEISMLSSSATWIWLLLSVETPINANILMN